MARRRKKPIFIDEPIQWHLVTSKHDRCPACGMKDVGYLGKTQRTCMNNVCGITVGLTKPSTEWYHDKMLGEPAVDAVVGAQHWLLPPKDGETPCTLSYARGLSKAGLAVIRRKEAWTPGMEIFWRADTPWPFYYEHGEEKQVCEPGSPLWRLLVQARWWVSARKKSPLELLAEQAPAPEDIQEKFLLMT